MQATSEIAVKQPAFARAAGTLGAPPTALHHRIVEASTPFRVESLQYGLGGKVEEGE